PLLLDLVNKSLVMADVSTDGHGEEPRYRLLETIRAYALEKLTQRCELDALQRRHAEAYAALAERAEPHFRSPEEKSWLERIARDLDNLRAALAWSRTPKGDRVTGLRLAGSLWPFWRWHGRVMEGRQW